MQLMFRKKLRGVKMIKEDIVKLGMWLGKKHNQIYERGKNDCCTLFMEYHDFMHGTNTLDAIYGKYSNTTGAIRTAREFNITEEWLPEHGYKQVDTPETGDIVIVQQKYYPSGYIICMGQAWTNVDGKNKMGRYSLIEPELPYSIWRHHIE